MNACYVHKHKQQKGWTVAKQISNDESRAKAVGVVNGRSQMIYLLHAILMGELNPSVISAEFFATREDKERAFRLALVLGSVSPKAQPDTHPGIPGDVTG